MNDRKIIHIDMDAFYASVEELNDPSLKNKPIAVGGTSKRGVLATANYEARKYGVRSAMPTHLALKKCPHLILVKPHFDQYKKISLQIRDIFYSYTDLVEPLSLDEAFLDVTSPKRGPHSATLIAENIRKEIFKETGLTASAGVSNCKFVAKVASDYNKPNGITIVPPHEIESFIEDLDIEKFFGVGKATAKKMHANNIFKGKDIKSYSLNQLTKLFGKTGLFFYNISRGIDERPVVPHRTRKSLGAERTFEENKFELNALLHSLDKISDEVWSRATKQNISGKTITVKIKYADFTQVTRSKTFNHTIRSSDELYHIAKDIMSDNFNENLQIRLLGITLSKLEGITIIKAGTQLSIDFNVF
ncbi:DNA polymerase IV [Aureibacter tunicatorum]|uniref:DNA polymerase IV n=1 Tax=Aureibacter tunicatorum TaxID=866807 RepID=A0AAE3XQ36_9BACT|nr:DNA polymerase IV [Aureibacter tunicatorum]MDR6239284.1 DNA polymerase-4 [Aureibacter tunicatorum]BDD04791.1 DNA polymerase IV 2 [Aureibacter tunicatorum]